MQANEAMQSKNSIVSNAVLMIENVLTCFISRKRTL